MESRFKKRIKMFDIGITAIAAVLSVSVMLIRPTITYGLVACFVTETGNTQ